MALQLQPPLIGSIKEAQKDNLKLQKFWYEVKDGQRIDMNIYADGSLWFGNRLCVPKWEVRQQELKEAHRLVYSVHLGETKIYQDLNNNFGGAERGGS